MGLNEFGFERVFQSLFEMNLIKGHFHSFFWKLTSFNSNDFRLLNDWITHRVFWILEWFKSPKNSNQTQFSLALPTFYEFLAVCRVDGPHIFRPMKIKPFKF